MKIANEIKIVIITVIGITIARIHPKVSNEFSSHEYPSSDNLYRSSHPPHV